MGRSWAGRTPMGMKRVAGLSCRAAPPPASADIRCTSITCDVVGADDRDGVAASVRGELRHADGMQFDAATPVWPCSKSKKPTPVTLSLSFGIWKLVVAVHRR